MHATLRSLRRWTFRHLYLPLFPGYPQELQKAIGDAGSVLDVGCGTDSPVGRIPRTFHSIGVDIYAPSLEDSRQKRLHDEYHELDVLEIDRAFAPRSIDAIVASDLIEHLRKPDGDTLLEKMERVARKRVIIFTPNGFLPQGDVGGNPWQRHLSGWTPAEMRSRGFRVIGVNGWKPLRGALAAPRWRPRLFWQCVSDLTEPLVRRHPEHAFQMLCVKEV